MTPEAMAGLVTRWVRWYTRDLPEGTAQRRAEEIAADLHDHTAYARSLGADDRRIALGILSRMARGLFADAVWRRRSRPAKGSLMKPVLTILVVAAGIALGVAAMVLGEADDSPGLQGIGLLLIIGAVVLSVRTVRRAR